MWITILVVSIIILLAIWELWICEGAHLGRRFVVWLYDLAAPRYESIKGFDNQWEQRFLGAPLAQTLGSLRGARVLDVGAGTGRSARALFQSLLFDGLMVNLEASRRMITEGRTLVGLNRGSWVNGWAIPLPFRDNLFDIVLCLEVLEFTPNPRRTLVELARVLRPGGWLLITNRVGWQAPLIVGRYTSRKRFLEVLSGAGLTDTEVYPWQKDYDLAWAHKPFPASAASQA